MTSQIIFQANVRQKIFATRDDNMFLFHLIKDLSSAQFIMASEDATASTLRKLRKAGKLNGTEIDDETARSLLKTPPSAVLSQSGMKMSPITLDSHSHVDRHRAATREETLADVVRTMESCCEAFQSTINDNSRVAREHMGRSLLQLFEDSVRERLPDALQKAGKVGGVIGFGGRPTAVAKHLSASRRPIDRGLDRRDHGSDLVIPDVLREAIANDIVVIVEHELKRVLGNIGGDLQRILTLVFQIKDRVSVIEEDVMQRQVDANMMTERNESLSSHVSSLEDELRTVRERLLEKDRQMDIVREQLARRNEALDDTRVRFRKEVMRYKNRSYELQNEVDSLARKARGGASNATGGNAERKQSVMPSLGSEQLDDDSQAEVFAATETAVKEATQKLQEDMRQVELRHIREKKLLIQEMNMKILERDQEILKWKDKVRQMQRELQMTEDEM